MVFGKIYRRKKQHAHHFFGREAQLRKTIFRLLARNDESTVTSQRKELHHLDVKSYMNSTTKNEKRVKRRGKPLIKGDVMHAIITFCRYVASVYLRYDN